VRTSISEITTVGASFAEDVAAYAAAGADGIGLWEFKLGPEDAADLALVRGSGLSVTHCVPAVPSILPLPLMEGPADPEERVEAICAGVRRLAAFEPDCVLFLTGPAGGDDGRGAVLEGCRRIGEEGERAGVRTALEPVQREFADYWTIPTTLDAAAELLDEAGAGTVGLMFDTWHLWNASDLAASIERHAGRIAGVHVADWREPTRSTNDRVFPGEGVAPLSEILLALERVGYAGAYDVEIFSDAELEGSLWALEPREAARRALESLRAVWETR
jgi:sugar phosphate isomerase/epimerase